MSRETMKSPTTRKAFWAVAIFYLIIGFMGFCLGAAQVYYHKLTKKSAATGGIYALVRHPQYASLVICGFGLLLLWPRYIVLLTFTAMIFVYYFLANYEEGECELQYGESYTAYMEKTSMFLPLRISLRPKGAFLPKSGMSRYFDYLSVCGYDRGGCLLCQWITGLVP